MEEQKIKITAYVQPKTAELVEKQYKLHGYRSRSEFIDAAIQFYIGFLNAKDYSGYLPNIVISTMKGALGSLEHRLANLLFKNTVELAILQHIIAAANDIDERTLREVRGMCVDDVKAINAALESVTLPVSLTTVEADAFCDCSGLKTVHYAGTQEQWNTVSVDSGNDSLTALMNKGSVAVTGVSLDKAKLELKVNDEPEQLLAVITPSDATNNSVVWTSSNEQVATVDAIGKVTPIGIGDTIITVTTNDGGFQATCNVKVIGEDGDLKDVDLTKFLFTLYNSEIGDSIYAEVYSSYGELSSTKVTTKCVKVEIVKNMLPLQGEGTSNKPYLITCADDLIAIREAVADGNAFVGQYFQFEKDVTLPDGWQPIGCTKDGSDRIDSGSNLNAFSGIINGAGHTLTVPVGGLPLLGYVWGSGHRTPHRGKP